MLSSRMSRSELSSHGPAAIIPRATVSLRLVGKEHVAGDLLLDESGVRLVVVERLDQVIAVGPGVAPDAVLVVAVRLGEVDQVHPVPRPALAVMRAGQQAIDQPLVGVGGVVDKKARTSSGSGGRPIRSKESRLIKVLRSASGGLETILAQLGDDEIVDRRPGPASIGLRGSGNLGARDRLEGPPRAFLFPGGLALVGCRRALPREVSRIRRTHLHPAAKIDDHRGGQLLLGGHFGEVFGVSEGAKDQAFLGLAGNHGRACLPSLTHRLARVKPQSALDLLRGSGVAGVAFLDENRTNPGLEETCAGRLSGHDHGSQGEQRSQSDRGLQPETLSSRPSKPQAWFSSIDA